MKVQFSSSLCLIFVLDVGWWYCRAFIMVFTLPVVTYPSNTDIHLFLPVHTVHFLFPTI